MQCLKCGNTDLSMLFRMVVEFPMDEKGDIYINDYEGYDDLLGKCIRDVDGKDKMYRYWKCRLEWRENRYVCRLN